MKLKKKIDKGEIWKGEVWVENKNKHLFPVIAEIFVIDEYIIEIFEDITELKKQKEYNDYLKYHNEFLDLPNRNYLKNEFSKLTNCTGILITLEDLSKLTKLWRCEIGDEFFLKSFSKDLLNITSKYNGRLFYLGENQFIFLLKTIDIDTTEKIVADILKLEKKSFKINKYFLNPVIFLGITVKKSRKNLEVFLNELAIAWDYAKKNGLKYSFYKEEYKKKIITERKIELLIKKSLKDDKFILYYQPRIDLKTNKVVSAEALIRMVGQKGEIIPPNFFIPIAEKSDLINRIGDWVVNRVFLDSRYITAKSGENLKFSFNISSNQFAEPNFINSLKNIIRYSKDYLSKFEIEITEWAMMKDVESSIEKMNTIRNLGFEIVIDDFGTGYSSLGYLKDFPINFIKIDKSFTDKVPGDIKTEKIVK